MKSKYRRTFTSWVCALALGCLLTFPTVPRYWWGTVIGVIYALFALKLLYSPKSRRLMIWGCVGGLAVGGIVGTLSAIHGRFDGGITFQDWGFLVYIYMIVIVYLIYLIWKEEVRVSAGRAGVTQPASG